MRRAAAGGARPGLRKQPAWLPVAMAIGSLAVVSIDSLSAPAAARGGAAAVTVVSPGGSRQEVTLDALAGQEDVVARAYVLRSSSGERTREVTGFGLATILTVAGADLYGFSYVEVRRPAGRSLLFSRHQALEPGAFADGPPVVYATANGTGFLRPSAAQDDLNAADSFEAPQGVTLALRKDSPLRVRAEASPRQTRAGDVVAFRAIVERAGSGEKLAYSWYFDDSHSATGPSATHRFARPGSYDVVLGVTAPGDETGASAVVTVQVGAPLAGPDRRGGGTKRDTKAPDHGAATGTPGAATGTPVAATGTPGAATGTPGAGSPAGPHAAPPTAAAPSPPRSRLCSHSEGKCDRGRSPRGRLGATATREGERVSGQLLTSEAVPIEPTSAASAARTGKLDEDESEAAELPDAALGLLATGALLGLGALVESRRLLG